MIGRASLAKGATAALCLGIASGCGVIVELSSSPDIAAPGGVVHFGIKLTNPSQCPVGDVTGELSPFVPADEVVVEGEPELEEVIRLLIAAVCTGSDFELPDDLECMVDGTAIECEVEDQLTTPGTSGSVTVRAGADVLLECTRAGSRFSCAAPSSGSGALVMAQQMLTCVPGMDGDQVCTLALLPGGQMATANLFLPAPSTPGTYYNILEGRAGRRGVCKNTGAPCGGDGDCPGGAMDVCADGVCIDNTTQAAGVGCDAEVDCPSSADCVACQPPLGAVNLPFACTQTLVRLQASTPVLSGWWLATAALGAFLAQILAWRLWRRT